MSDLALPGCRTEPLGSYLKALGVLRLVAEQKDPGAEGCWTGDVFRLQTSLDRGDLESFFMEEYRPTPLLAPWNSGSGFRTGGKRPEAERALGLIESSDDPRLRGYRRAIEAGREVVRDAESQGWRGKGEEFWEKKSKHLVVERCRATFPDDAIRWIDASVVLAAEPEWRVPLLGTGGNLGSQELSISFMQRVAEILELRPSGGKRHVDDPPAWLAAALFDDRDVRKVSGPVGQFDPGAAGGANSSPFGAARTLVNPWDFVLMLEGALLFGSAAARRLSAGARGSVAIPFTFRATAVGFGSASDSEADASEVWTPIWTQPSTLGEISHLIGEGRGEWAGRQAASALDMAKAAASLGVDRGVAAFGRNLIAKRFGQSMLATPIGRVDVRAGAEVPILAALDRWVQVLGRGKNPPSTLVAARRRLDTAMFDVSTRGGPLPLQRVVIAAAEAEEAVGRAGSFRGRNAAMGPIRGLPAGEWLPLLDDGSPELRLAAALASQHDDDGRCLRSIFRPVRRSDRNRWPEWSEAPPAVPGLGLRSTSSVLAEGLVRRSIEVGMGEGVQERVEQDGAQGVQIAFRRRLPAPANDVARLAAGRVDEPRLAGLLSALMLLDWAAIPQVQWPSGTEDVEGPPDPVWALLAPFFHGRPIRLVTDRMQLEPARTWPRQLASGQVGSVVSDALRRLRIARLQPAPSDAATLARASASGSRLAAALLVPVSSASAARLLRFTVPRPPE